MNPGETYLLAWTTTPWTLPGNIALAVGKDIAYGNPNRMARTVMVYPRAENVLGKMGGTPFRTNEPDIVGNEY